MSDIDDNDVILWPEEADALMAEIVAKLKRDVPGFRKLYHFQRVAIATVCMHYYCEGWVKRNQR